MKNKALKINLIQLFGLIFKTSENLDHGLTLRTLSSIYIHELKLELVLVFDRSRR